MGKLFDYAMTDSWEEFQRIQLYKKIGNFLEIKNLSAEQIKEIEKIIDKKK